MRRALGLNAKAQRSAKIERLEQKNAELQERLDALEARALPIAGIDDGEKVWEVTVGGETVAMRALPPLEWLKALDELPSFLLAYAVAKRSNTEMNEEDVDALMARAKDWISACAVTEDLTVGYDQRESLGDARGDAALGVMLERLSVPEAMDALVRISRLNGLDEQLAAWFRRSTEHQDAGPGGETLPHPAPRPVN